MFPSYARNSEHPQAGPQGAEHDDAAPVYHKRERRLSGNAGDRVERPCSATRRLKYTQTSSPSDQGFSAAAQLLYSRPSALRSGIKCAACTATSRCFVLTGKSWSRHHRSAGHAHLGRPRPSTGCPCHGLCNSAASSLPPLAPTCFVRGAEALNWPVRAGKRETLVVTGVACYWASDPMDRYSMYHLITEEQRDAAKVLKSKGQRAYCYVEYRFVRCSFSRR